jgi:hypothetical protein
MKVPLTVLLLISVSVAPQTANKDQQRPGGPGSPGIVFVDLTSEEKMVDRKEFPPGMVSYDPPVLKPNPNAHRGIDRNEPEIKKITRDRSEREQDLRASIQTSPPPPAIKIPAFAFRAQVKNETSVPVVRFVWSYQPSSVEQEFQSKEYLCNARIEPATVKEVKIISPIPRNLVVNVSDSHRSPARLSPSLKDLSIKYVEFADGSIWQHPDWKSTQLLTKEGTRKLSKGKCTVL